MNIKSTFEKHGYCVIRNAVPKELCQKAITAFNKEVKPDKRFFIRHESSMYERHVFTEEGFMKYPIMNIQDLLSNDFKEFRQRGLEVLTTERIKQSVTEILDSKVEICHTMYFDGNQETWNHRDSDYIDPEQSGRTIGVWVAAEDIHPGAGTFYLYEGSHRATLPPTLNIKDLDPNSAEYKAKVRKYFDSADSEYKRVAPALKQGDAIVWSSMTFHGSLATSAPDRSRRSFTAHYIPADNQHPTFRKSIRTTTVGGIEILRSYNQTNRVTQMLLNSRENHPIIDLVCSALEKPFFAVQRIRRKIVMTTYHFIRNKIR